MTRGAVLVDPRPDADDVRLLVAITEEIIDGHGDRVARRFGYVIVDPELSVSGAGPAPYLGMQALTEDQKYLHLPDLAWCVEAEEAARTWAIATDLPAYAREVGDRVTAEVDRTRAAVDSRLKQEANRLYTEAAVSAEREKAGRDKVRSATLVARAEDLERRRTARLTSLDARASLQVRPPTVAGAALVVSAALLDREWEGLGSREPPTPPTHAKETRAVERRAVDLVLAAERSLGREPEEMPHNNPGYDVRSVAPDGHLVHLEVKGQLSGAEDFFVTYNEVLFGKNAAPRYRLALVSVSPDGAEHDGVRYVGDPFATTSLGGFASTGIRGDWAKTWSSGRPPY